MLAYIGMFELFIFLGGPGAKCYLESNRNRAEFEPAVRVNLSREGGNTHGFLFPLRGSTWFSAWSQNSARSRMDSNKHLAASSKTKHNEEVLVPTRASAASRTREGDVTAPAISLGESFRAYVYPDGTTRGCPGVLRGARARMRMLSRTTS